MTDTNPAWNELFELLGPIHDDVQLFARRIARSNAEGDDVFQEAVLRAARKLGSLRDRSRFKSWMYSVVSSVHRTRYRGSFWKRWISSDDVKPLESWESVCDASRISIGRHSRKMTSPLTSTCS